ncbi:MAG: hypothetical protein A2359_00240 [Candidatus Moranbacteria bacterium RIFOXYB1_FULL_43_19]|nr:MAG: hypothetical protein A2359_00240 [Candidatus Moranbacteria bacterium RIFOXYB1_FULL_43_19]OGI33735.1 MAG: hypothetical protein A2420_04875 [Candidatus Moranbacteria bacterium RIFOXYC1_FULL_44_13]OGI38023.1 MAG: hypothetical protein A2612_00425 [Candidatus Moranbacteria bacterium RIFOXYD1_FULL_44_12]
MLGRFFYFWNKTTRGFVPFQKYSPNIEYWERATFATIDLYFKKPPGYFLATGRLNFEFPAAYFVFPEIRTIPHSSRAIFRTPTPEAMHMRT